MGTTESLPYDDGPHAESGPSSQQGVHDGPQQRSVTPSLSVANKAPTRPLTRLSGALVGGAKVGKLTLLRRLMGKDPNDSSVDSESLPKVVAIPYSPPPGMPTWNRIQLLVDRVSDEALPKVDFLVVLVRPDRPEQVVHNRIFQVIRQHMHHLGFTGKDVRVSSEAEAESVSICVIVNFRDLVKDESAMSKLDGLQNSLEAFLADTMGRYSIKDDRLLLQVISASVQNGYGLDRLHHFIYRAYLQKKRDALEAQLRAVTNQIKVTSEPTIVSHNSSVYPIAPSSQDATLPVTSRSERTGDKPRPKIPPREGTEMQRREGHTAQSPKQPDATQKLDQSRDTHVPDSAKEPTRSMKDTRRQIHTHNNPTPRIGKDALEAFLASDSSDDDKHAPRTKNIGLRKQVKSRASDAAADSSDDDDDSDYFYDESGTFKNTNALREDDSSSSEPLTMSPYASSSVALQPKVPQQVSDDHKNVTSIPVERERSPGLSDASKGHASSISASLVCESGIDRATLYNENKRPEMEYDEVLPGPKPERESIKRGPKIASVNSSLHHDEKDQNGTEINMPLTSPTAPQSNSATSSHYDTSDKSSELENQTAFNDMRTKEDAKTVEVSEHGAPEALSSSTDAVGIRSSNNHQSSNDQTDGGSDSDSQLVGQNCEAKDTATSRLHISDDNDDEDQFFVHQRNYQLSGASSRVTTGGAWSSECEGGHYDDEFFVTGEQMGPSSKVASIGSDAAEEADVVADVSDQKDHATVKLDQDDSDDDFVIEDSRERGQELPLSVSSAIHTAPVSNDSSPHRSGGTNRSMADSQATSVQNSGISAAALAAIQAAQEQAEAMLLSADTSSYDGGIAKKSKKSKKEKKPVKDGKKKKKKDKATVGHGS